MLELPIKNTMNTHVTQACVAALDFLLSTRTWEGRWRDFLLAPGFSDEWVTGYVGTVLATTADARAVQAASNAWHVLAKRQRPSGAWAYNMLPPGDVDSTGWGLQLANAVGCGSSLEAQRAQQFLLEHVHSNGGISTYPTDGPIRRFINLPISRSLRGWCRTHPCVSAAVALIPALFIKVRPYLHAMQQDDGHWQSYWWCDDEYATCLATEAMARGGFADDVPRIERAVRWAHARISGDGCVRTERHPQGSPFATAWCLQILLHAHEPADVHEKVHAAVTWLVDHQQPDGAWTASAWLRVPQPDDEHPEVYGGWVVGGKIQGSVVVDQHAVFTTATVLNVLQMVDSVSLTSSISQEHSFTSGARQ